MGGFSARLVGPRFPDTRGRWAGLRLAMRIFGHSDGGVGASRGPMRCVRLLAPAGRRVWRFGGRAGCTGPAGFERGRSGVRRGLLFELDGGVVEPVEPEVVAREVEPPAPAAAHQPSHDPHQIADQGPQAMAPGAGRQQLVLDRAQQHLRDLAADVEGLIGAEPPARRVMQVEVDQRPLEGVLLALLPAVRTSSSSGRSSRETRITV